MDLFQRRIAQKFVEIWICGDDFRRREIQSPHHSPRGFFQVPGESQTPRRPADENQPGEKGNSPQKMAFSLCGPVPEGLARHPAKAKRHASHRMKTSREGKRLSERKQRFLHAHSHRRFLQTPVSAKRPTAQRMKTSREKKATHPKKWRFPYAARSRRGCPGTRRKPNATPPRIKPTPKSTNRLSRQSGCFPRGRSAKPHEKARQSSFRFGHPRPRVPPRDITKENRLFMQQHQNPQNKKTAAPG